MPKTIVSNFIWKLLERCGTQGVTLIVSIILARLLEPTVYGTVALVTIFITIMQVFVDAGMGNALIQKKNADNIDFSSVFYLNLLVSAILYAIMFFAAPLIAVFFDIPELTDVVRVLSLVLIVYGLKNIQQAYVSRQMLFKRYFFATLGGTIGGGIVGIAMAYLGYGVWALVAYMLFSTVIGTVLLWFIVRWRPDMSFSIQRIKGLFSYGWKLLVSSLIDTIYNDLRQLLIGKIYTKEELALYNQGEKFPKVIVTNINASIDSILFPTMSKVQDEPITVKKITQRAIMTSTYVMMPLMVCLAVCAEQIVSLILTDKWLSAVPFLRIFCFTFAFWPIHTANLNAIKAMGRSDLFLKLEIIKNVIGVIALVSTMWISVMAMAYSLIVTSVLSQIINSWPNKNLINYSYIEQIKDMFPQICLSIVMGLILYFIQYVHLNQLALLCIQISVGLLVYVLGSKLLQIDSYNYLLSVLKELVGRKKE